MADEPTTSSADLLTEDEQFQRVLQLFRVVRSRDYHEDETNAIISRANGQDVKVQESFGHPSEQTKVIDQVVETTLEEPSHEESFWAMLNAAAEQKLGRGDGQRFCDAFRKVHTELVYKTLSLEDIKLAAKNWDVIANSSTC